MSKIGNESNSGADHRHDSASLDRLPSSLIDSARVQEDRRKDDRGDMGRRASDRVKVEATASLSASLANSVEGRLYDLSATGCALELDFASFDVGDDVWFRIDTIQPWKGVVRWRDGNKIGVEFVRPFYPAVFELIAQANQPVSVSKAA